MKFSPILPSHRNVQDSAVGENIVGSPDQFYRPELDWLRFLAYVMVFAVHAFPRDLQAYAEVGLPDGLTRYVLSPIIQAGVHGVDLFFVLSAFLITELLLLERERTGSVHVGAFYIRRILRIWPLYFVFIAVVFPVEFHAFHHPIHYYASFLMFMGNWHVVFWGATLNFTGHLWTVCVEEQFYLVWPVLLRQLPKRRLVVFLVVLFLFATFYRTTLVVGAWDDASFIHRNTFARMDCFALGGLLACLLHKRNLIVPFPCRAALLSAAVGMLWFVGISPGGSDAKTALWCYPLAVTACTMILSSFVTMPALMKVHVVHRVLSYLGKISYGLYMWHLPALALTRLVILPDGSMPPAAQLASRVSYAFVLTIIVSVISYEVLEKPFLRMKRRFTFVESRPA